jgi:general secretion pathway protein G
MLRRIRTHRPARRRAGFTLMEVLLVVAILLILGSIVAVSFTGIFSGAEEDTTKSAIDNVAKAVSYFKFQCRRAPASIEELVSTAAPPGLETKWHGPYLQDVPKDAWGQEITFADDGNNQTFTVTSPGPPGGQKPITATKKY